MYKIINFSDFCDAFSEDRQVTYSYEGKKALFEYLEEIYDDSKDRDGRPIGIELDIISLCCDYTEYDNIEDVQAQYPKIKDLDDLRDNTQVIECENGHIIILSF